MIDLLPFLSAIKKKKNLYKKISACDKIIQANHPAFFNSSKTMNLKPEIIRQLIAETT